MSLTGSTKERKDLAQAGQQQGISHKVVITASFTSEPVKDSLDFWMQEIGIPCLIEFAPYNQILQQLLDINSLQSRNEQGVNVVLVRFEDWQKDKETDDVQTFDEKLNWNVEEFLLALQAALQRSAAPYLVCICPASPTALADPHRVQVFQDMEERLVSELNNISGAYLVTSSELTATYPVADYYDPYGEENGNIPYTPVFFSALGTAIARIIRALKSRTYKVIALDCDNTLWSGVCGEDGAAGVKIDPPYQALQEFIVAQQEAGKLICLCSKNHEDDVFAVFERYQDMPLKRHHLVNWRVNWQPKSENLKSLACELQLGLDSFIFIDDNPVECMEVRANWPEVLTLQLPEDPNQIPRFLEHIWVFDQLKVTKEDKKRTELYWQNVQRERFRQDLLTFADFLAGLGLEIEIAHMEPEQLQRVAQLTERTNQFNLTTIRRSQGEIQQICDAGSLECRLVKVKDRFGDYGLVGLLLFASQGETLTVDTFLLSCRVLGRGVEHRMLAHLGAIAQERRLSRVEVSYLPTKKNQPALDFLESIGEQFKQEKDGGWLFQFPSAMAAELTFNPNNGQTTPTQTARQPKAVSLVSLTTPAALFERIANKLYSPELILKDIASRQQRQRPESETAFVPPRTPVEQAIASLFAELLRLDPGGYSR